VLLSAVGCYYNINRSVINIRLIGAVD